MLYTQRSPDNLLVGAGNLFLAIVAGGTKAPWRHAGNCPTLELTTADTKIQKFSSMNRGRPLYKEALQRRLVTVRAILDEFMFENFALHAQGAIQFSGAQAATPIANEVLYANVPAATLGAALGGTWFRVASAGRVYGVTGQPAPVVSVGATNLTLGTDYEIDDSGTMIGILAGSTAVTNGTDDLLIDYTPEAFGQIIRIRGGSESNIEVAGLFKPDPSTGPRWEVEWWRGATSPDGALGLISEDFASMTLNFQLQSDASGQYGGSADFPTHMATLLNPPGVIQS